eukprot:m.192410 g.192410  ORF g.192410 m.192410 type:complete len:573 (-) comp18633_c0_seq1:255-1973(-)
MQRRSGTVPKGCGTSVATTRCLVTIVIVSTVMYDVNVAHAFTMTDRYHCGVCMDMTTALSRGQDFEATCERYSACHLFHPESPSVSSMNCSAVCNGTDAHNPLIHIEPTGGTGQTAPRSGSANTVEDTRKTARRQPATAASDAPIDVRVTMGFGTKPYGTLRVSAITASGDPTPPLTVDGQAVSWQYSDRFRYKWTDNALHTVVLPHGGNITVGSTTVLRATAPPSDGGVAGVLIGDPCVHDASITSLVACFYGKKFETKTRTPALLNALVGAQDPTAMQFWAILGDNFYDRTGATTKKMFAAISTETKARPFLSVPGNHDYWVLGTPEVGTVDDQYGNGFMQYYGQDTLAAHTVLPNTTGAAAVPYNFSIDPHKGHVLFGGNKPVIDNSFVMHRMGNLGVIGFSGAYTLEETQPLMAQACLWLGDETDAGTVQVGMIVGHWDIKGAGASADMAVPGFYDHMRVLPGCDTLDQRGMLKFFMGHTHCNVPHPHGHVNTGFMVAGQGMEGCGNYGMPIVDTTEGRVRVYHFEIVAKNGTDSYDATMSCLSQSATWRNCTHLADVWLDQPIPPSD